MGNSHTRAMGHPYTKHIMSQDGKIKALPLLKKIHQMDAWDFLTKKMVERSFHRKNLSPENIFLKNASLYKGENTEQYLKIFLDNPNTFPLEHESAIRLLGKENFSKLQRGDNYLWSLDGTLFYFLYCAKHEGSLTTYQALFQTKEQETGKSFYVTEAYANRLDSSGEIIASYTRQQIDSVKEMCRKFQENESTMIPLSRSPKYLFYLEETKEHLIVDAFCSDWQVSIIGKEGSARHRAKISIEENATSIHLSNGATITIPNAAEAYFTADREDYPLQVLDMETFDYSTIGIPSSTNNEMQNSISN